MIKKYLKPIITLCMVFTVLLAFTACSSVSNTGTSGQNAATNPTASPQNPANPSGNEAVKPLEKVSLLVNYTAAEAPSENSEVIQRILDYTGTKLNVQWIPQSAYNEKLNTLISSQSLPEITVVRDVKASGIVNAARSGMLWDVSSYLSDYVNLSNLDKNVLKNVQIDGKQFMIPRMRDVARAGAVLRTDWLKNVGLEMPETLDELYTVLQAFKNNDPDKNGKNDTYGFSLKYNALPRFSTLISVYNGGPNEWGLDEKGNVVPEFYSDTYTEALNWFRKAYTEGLFNQDFPVCKDEIVNFTSGAAGMLWLGNVEDASTRLTDLKGVFPDATTDIFMILTGTGGGKYLPAHTGYTGSIIFPKTAVKDEAALKAILSFIDKLGDAEMADLFNWGIESKTYTVDGGSVVQTPEQAELYGSQYNDFRQITPFYTTVHLKAKDLPVLNVKIREQMDANIQYVVNNYALPYISDTYVESGGELQSFIDDAKVKYVIGEIDLDGWKAAIETWKSMGGEKVIKEYTDQYNLSK